LGVENSKKIFFVGNPKEPKNKIFLAILETKKEKGHFWHLPRIFPFPPKKFNLNRIFWGF